MAGTNLDREKSRNKQIGKAGTNKFGQGKKAFRTYGGFQVARYTPSPGKKRSDIRETKTLHSDKRDLHSDKRDYIPTNGITLRQTGIAFRHTGIIFPRTGIE